ncbi:MAG: TonB family protein [Candidatus Binatia bacterium]
MVERRSAFGQYGGTERVPRQWVTALVASAAVYVGLAAVVLALGLGAGGKRVPDAPVDVTFVERVVKEAPAPKPVEIPPEVAPAAAPVVPKEMKVRRLEKPPPPKELVAPRAMPKEAPREADPSQDKGIAVQGEPDRGDPAGLEGGTAGGVAGGHVGAIALPEGADPPVPSRSNARPEYPKAARRVGRTGTVMLKIVITADGRVSDVQVQAGEEPFTTAAVEAVRTWRYQPARFKGVPISVWKLVEVGFTL